MQVSLLARAFCAGHLFLFMRLTLWNRGSRHVSGLQRVWATAAYKAWGRKWFVKPEFLFGNKYRGWGKIWTMTVIIEGGLLFMYESFQCLSFSKGFCTLACRQSNFFIEIGTDVPNFPLFFRLLVFDEADTLWWAGQEATSEGQVRAVFEALILYISALYRNGV